MVHSGPLPKMVYGPWSIVVHSGPWSMVKNGPSVFSHKKPVGVFSGFLRQHVNSVKFCLGYIPNHYNEHMVR